ncbi:MAG: AAA family ATPase [Nitrospirota bacterium]
MEITIKNCNSIDETKIELHADILNIKYGMNGIGKSTIVKAIELATANESADISDLMPFKYMGKPEEEVQQPSIEGLDSINTVSIFNEDYVDQFVFKQDEVVSNSFEIFIKTNEYDQKMEEIEKLVFDIRETFKNDDRLDQVIKDLSELCNSFGKPVKTGISGAAPINKAFGKKGNKVQNVPESLKAYTPFLQSSDNVKWIDWQIKGNNFLEISNDCPYCTSPTSEKKETIQAISQEYDKKSIEHLNNILKALAGLGKYFSFKTQESLAGIVNSPDCLSKEAENFLSSVWNDIGTLKDKLSAIKDVSFFSFKDDKDVENKVKQLKIDLSLIPHMDSEEAKSIVDNVNQSIDTLLGKIGLLQGQVAKQKIEIQKTIQKHNKEINDFLKYAGYDYHVDIEEDGDLYKMRLKHKDFGTSISNSSKHLSYGERNAFSLVLFMYESLSKNSDLIILDDPISSFDRNKKFAIVEMLFKRTDSFKGKTVLMMTHDFEPIVDMISTLKGKFQPVPHASFLQRRNGIVTEIPIDKGDITSFAQVCTKNIESSVQDIVKLIYLRRYYEIMDNKGNEYHILASLLHKRPAPTLNSAGVDFMPQADIQEATENIKNDFIPTFDYTNHLGVLNDNDQMISLYQSTNNNYEKLQIFRIMNAGNLPDNDVIQKFINETFHIENEYVMQLNPLKYDFIPQYIISECDKTINV